MVKNKPKLAATDRPQHQARHKMHKAGGVNQSQTLGLGLKFRPLLRPPAAHVFKKQIQDYCRSVWLHYKYADQPDDPDFNPKLYVKSEWNPP